MRGRGRGDSLAAACVWGHPHVRLKPLRDGRAVARQPDYTESHSPRPSKSRVQRTGGDVLFTEKFGHRAWTTPFFPGTFLGDCLTIPVAAKKQGQPNK